MTLIRTCLLAGSAAGALTLTACDTVSAPEDPSFLLASFNGAVEMEFHGSGHFHSGVDPRRPAAPIPFSISSTGRGAQANQFIQFFRAEAAIPAPGVYPINQVVGGEMVGFRVSYQTLDRRGSTQELYSATEGEVEILDSSEERITGNFRFSAHRVCEVVSSGPGFSCTPVPPTPDTPTVTVTGSFLATRSNGVSGVIRM